MNKILLITISIILMLTFFIIFKYFSNYEKYIDFIEHTHDIKHKHMDFGYGLYGKIIGDLSHYHGNNKNIQKAKPKEYCTTNIIDSYCYPFKEIVLKKNQNCEDKCTEINGCNGYFTHNNKCFICNGKFRKNNGDNISNMNIKPDKKSRTNKVSDLHICNWNNAHKSTCRLSENESSICNNCYNFHNSLNVGVDECNTICENKSDCKAFFIKKDSNNMDKCFLCDSFSDSCQTLNLTEDDKTKLTHECYYDDNKIFDEYIEKPHDDIIIDEDKETENIIESSQEEEEIDEEEIDEQEIDEEEIDEEEIDEEEIDEEEIDEEEIDEEEIDGEEIDDEEENECGYNKFINSSGQCETCKSCSKGKYNSNYCKNETNTKCEFCKKGTYKNYTGNKPCNECSIGPCPSGEIKTKKCNIVSDRKCTLCKSNTYKVTTSIGEELCVSCDVLNTSCKEIARPDELQNIEWLEEGRHSNCSAYSKGYCERRYNECYEDGICEQKTAKYYYDTNTWDI